MKLKTKMSLLVFLTTLSIVSVGFSSWSISSTDSIGGNIEVDNVTTFDYKNTAYTIKYSEFGFDYYIYGETYFYTSSTMGYKIKIRPDLLETNFKGHVVSLNLGIGYEYDTSKDLLLFDDSNQYFDSPKHAKISVDNSVNRFIYSSDLYHSLESTGSWTTEYKLLGNVLLYSEDKPSLYSIAKDFQVSTNYVYLTINFEFIVKEYPTNFETINFDFYSSLEEVLSWETKYLK